MRTYILKRIALMVPTFFAISLVIFLILNLAPGKPGGSLAGGETQDATGSKRESYRIFKTQFNLDKPVLFNTRYNLNAKTVRKSIENMVNEGNRVKMKEVIKAQDDLEDFGQYSVPALIQIMNSEKNPKVRDMAVQILAQNGQRPLRGQYDRRPDDSTKRLNQEIDKENTYLRTLVYSDDAEEKSEVTKKWNEWYDTHRERFTYGFGRKMSIFFLDTRFAKYWWNLAHLDFGVSHVDKLPVIGKIVSKLKYSLSLSVPSVLIAYIISVPLGIFSSVRQNTFYDRLIAAVLFMLYSLPSFFVATLLLIFFSKGGDYLHIFPTSGYQNPDYWQLTTVDQIRDVLWHLVLPLISLTYASFASLSRYARSGMLEVIRSDYIRTARAKGLSEFVVIMKHALRNGIIPIITLLGTILPVLLGGSVIIEYIFGIPGMGLLTYTAILTRDYNVIMGVELIAAILVLVGILVSDILYAIVDPRVSFK